MNSEAGVFLLGHCGGHRSHCSHQAWPRKDVLLVLALALAIILHKLPVQRRKNPSGRVFFFFIAKRSSALLLLDQMSSMLCWHGLWPLHSFLALHDN